MCTHLIHACMSCTLTPPHSKCRVFPFFPVSFSSLFASHPILQIFSFRTASAPGARYPLHFAAVGDIGQTSFSLETCRNIHDNSLLQGAFLVGDLSYADGNGSRWDTWEQDMEPWYLRSFF